MWALGSICLYSNHLPIYFLKGQNLKGKQEISFTNTKWNKKKCRFIKTKKLLQKCILWDFSGGLIVRIHLLIQGTWIRFLVSELRSHVPWSNTCRRATKPLSQLEKPVGCNERRPCVSQLKKSTHTAMKTKCSQKRKCIS